MKLSKYDNKRIRLVDSLGDTYEGICTYNNKEYNEHEYGENEESLQMSYIIFYKNQIKKVDIIDNYSDKYGKLEELIVDSELNIVEEIFEDEDNEIIYRLLLYIEDHLESISNKEKLNRLLNYLIKYNKDKKIIEKTKKLLNGGRK